MIHHHEGGLRVLDLDSAAGTYVNGTRLQPRAWRNLPSDAQLRCGKVLFRVSIDHSQSRVEKAVEAGAAAGGDSMLAGQPWHDVDVAGFLESEDDAEREQRYGNIRKRNSGQHADSGTIDLDNTSDTDAEFDTNIDLDLFEEEFEDGVSPTPSQDDQQVASEPAIDPDNGSGPAAAPQSDIPAKKRKAKKPSRPTPGRSKAKKPKVARARGFTSPWADRERMQLIGTVVLALAVMTFCGYSCYRFYTGPEVRVIKDID